jgi:hypothetical protein
MENTGLMSKDFENFLYERLTGTGAESEGGIVPDVIDEIDPVIEKILTDVGMPKDARKELVLDEIYTKILEHQEAVYSQGVKDGAQLMLHLLGKAVPENVS